MPLNDCPRCGGLELYGPATCSCQGFEVAVIEHDVNRVYDNKIRRYTAELEIEWHRVYATSVTSAAEKHLQISDQDACEGITNEAHVLVRHEGTIEILTVHGELEPTYYATDHDKVDLQAAQKIDQLLPGLLPDNRRPQSYVGESYYTPERVAEREKWAQERREREQARDA